MSKRTYIPLHLDGRGAAYLTYADSGNLVALGDDVKLMVTVAADSGQNCEVEYEARIVGADYDEDGELRALEAERPGYGIVACHMDGMAVMTL